MDTKYVIVPQKHLDAIEKARLELYEMFDPMTTDALIDLHRVTEPMWLAANKKYPEYVDPKS